MAARNTATLSPLDQVMPRVYTRIFLTFATKDVATAVHRLNLGLQQTCDQLPFLKGHVFSLPGSLGLLAISWADSDPTPPLQEIDAANRAPSYASLIRDGAQLHHFRNWMCPVDSMPNHAISDTKAAAVAFSYVRLDGGMILCICVHHSVMDGTGVGEFVSILAANCMTKDTKGDSSTLQAVDSTEPLSRYSKLTSILTAAIKQNESLSQGELLERHPEYRLMSSLPIPNASKAVAMVTGTSKIFEFQVSKIIEAKTAVNAIAGAASPSLSINNILSALIWSFISRIRSSRLPEDQLKTSSRLGFAINARKHLGPELENSLYLGNVNLFGLTSAPFQELTMAGKCSYTDVLEKSSLQELASIASKIRHSISEINLTHIGEVISLMDKSPNAADVIPGWSFWNGPDLSMTSWASLRLYDCDFGETLGRPDFVRIPYAEVDGLVIILPRRASPMPQPHEERAVACQEVFDVVVMLRKDDMEALETNEAWLSWGPGQC